MRQRIEVRCVDSEIRVEQMREADSQRLGRKAEQLAVCVKETSRRLPGRVGRALSRITSSTTSAATTVPERSAGASRAT
jgi:hypothetical protein